MHGGGKSDRLIVAEKRSNKDGGAPRSAERVEPSGLAKGNRPSKTSAGHRAGRGIDMEDSKRAPSGKSRTQPRDRTYVETEDLQVRWNGYGR